LSTSEKLTLGSVDPAALQPHPTSHPLFADLTAKERVEVFRSHKDGGSQATFYRIKEKLRM
jgi:hypothetical protein